MSVEQLAWLPSGVGAVVWKDRRNHDNAKKQSLRRGDDKPNKPGEQLLPAGLCGGLTKQMQRYKELVIDMYQNLWTAVMNVL